MNPEDIIQMACKGNAEAERFCLSWAEFCHLLDDLADRDKPVTDETMASVFLNYTLELCGNPWFLANRAQLAGLMVQSANYWRESNQRRGAERDILKAQWHSVIYHAAFIIGGWPHLRQVTSETLEFDYEKEDKK